MIRTPIAVNTASNPAVPWARQSSRRVTVAATVDCAADTAVQALTLLVAQMPPIELTFAEVLSGYIESLSLMPGRSPAEAGL